MQNYVNSANPSTTVNANITNSGTTLTVTSEAYLPGAANYTILVGPVGGPYEIMLVTGGVGTLSLTVSRGQEGSSAVSHNIGEVVYHPMTAGTLNSIRADMSSYGTYSSLPSGGHKGDRYSATDQQNDFVYSGSAWQTIPRGAWVPLQGVTANNTSPNMNFTSWYSTKFSVYVLEFDGVQLASNNISLSLQMSTNGGSSYDSSSSYTYGWEYVYGAGSVNGFGSNGDTQIVFQGNISNSASYTIDGSLRMFAAGSSSTYKIFMGSLVALNSSVGLPLMTTGYATYNNTTAVNAFTIFASSGNIAAGTVTVYGIYGA
jgi:hypothetical protein